MAISLLVNKYQVLGKSGQDLPIWQTPAMLCSLWVSLFALIATESIVFVRVCIALLNDRLVTDALQGPSHNTLLYMWNTFIIWNYKVKDLVSHWTLASRGTQDTGSYWWGYARLSCSFQDNHIKDCGI